MWTGDLYASMGMINSIMESDKIDKLENDSLGIGYQIGTIYSSLSQVGRYSTTVIYKHIHAV